jgi:hypothetical protein
MSSMSKNNNMEKVFNFLLRLQKTTEEKGYRPDLHTDADNMAA